MHCPKNLVFVGLLIAIACGSNACSYDEGYFKHRIKELDELTARASPGMRIKIEKKKAELLADFQKRPRGNQDAMDRLCRRARMTVKEAKQIMSVVGSANKQTNAAELAAYRKKFVGVWKGVGTSLNIDTSGKVKYDHKKGATSKKVTAGIIDFQMDHFTVGFMGITTTLKINRGPREDGGVWKMKIDGVELIRIGEAPTQPSKSSVE